MMQTLEAVGELLSGVVRDMMTKTVEFAYETVTINEVAQQLAKNNLRRIIIVDEEDKIVGVVTQRDLLRSYLSAMDSKEPANPVGCEPIKTLITRAKPVTVTPDVLLVKAAVVLGANKIGCLPVVGIRGELLGVITISDLLRRISGHNAEQLEEAFQFFAPSAEARAKMPAFIRKVTGELVIPLKCMEDASAVTEWVALGFDPPTGRILLKFVSQETKSDGAIKVKRIDGNLVIPARGFVLHFDLLGKTSAFDLEAHEDGQYYILKPRQFSKDNKTSKKSKPPQPEPDEDS